MDKYNIEFSKEEIVALIQLVDIATQHKGLQVAEVAVYFHNKFRGVVSEDEKLKEK